MNYLAYHFTVEPLQPGSEILMALLADQGFESFMGNESGFTAYIAEANASQADPNVIDPQDFSFSFKVEQIAERNWNEEWEKSFGPVVIGNLLCIRTPFHEPVKNVKHQLVIMPRMSFGTGHHETTRLMCRELFETALDNKRVLDMGTGTGILAILAEKLGAAEVLAVDNDEWSISNAADNIGGNGCDRIKLKPGSTEAVSGEARFDIVLANINRNILLRQIPLYAALLKTAGILLMSGFFVSDMPDLEACAGEHGLLREHYMNENDWAMLRFRKAE